MPLNSVMAGESGNKPLGITMGCPVGIGPEIILRYLVDRKDVSCPPVVLGDAGVLGRCRDLMGFPLPIKKWQPGDTTQPGVINILSLSNLDTKVLQWGQPTVETGQAMAGYIETAVSLIQQGELSAVATCPITKTALRMAGYPYPGHTEMLAALNGSHRYAMMMASHDLKVTLATIHTSLANVADDLSRNSIADLIDLTGASLQKDFGMASPHIAVAGLNPHAGEDGMFGQEEKEIITPAVEDARRAGWNVTGPLPPDTVFVKAMQEKIDAVVCMYHDQGLIPFKMLHFKDGVNVTIGLPIIRTSVDHGTAYDIAGKGLAHSDSLVAACSMAEEIVKNRRTFA